MAAVAFYISGHGFGHASRQVEIINALGRRRPDIDIFLRTAVQRSLLDRTLTTPVSLDDRPVDTGLVQMDSLRLDVAASIAQARDFHHTLPARAAAEAPALRQRGVRFVVSDAPALGCAAADRAGIPSVVVSNFTWDWIYAEYRAELRSAPDLVPAIQDAYRLATGAWRLPMHGGFETFWEGAASDRVIDVPFVARRAARQPVETRTRLGLPLDARLVLPSFGGYGLPGLELTAVDAGEPWRVVQCSDSQIQAAGLRYEDLVRAVDVVITKPGFGIVSECIANGTAMVYTSRGRFAEYPVMVAEMPRFLRCAYIDHDALMRGRWRDALDAALNAPAPPEAPRTDGAEVIADMIAARVHTSPGYA